MAGGERFRGTGTGAVARILQEHRACDAGFDVSRDEGPPGGRLTIRCKGCGEEMVYHASDAASWGALQGVDLGFPLENGVGERAGARPGGPGWRPVAITAALVLAAALAAVLLTGEGGDGDSGPSPLTSAERPPGSAERPPGQSAAGKTAEPKPAARLKGAPVVLEPRVIPSANFSIGVAPGWDQGFDDGAVVFARNPDAEVRVFYESGTVSYRTLLEGLEDLLRYEHPDAKISAAASFEFGDVSGRRLRADYRGGREVGVATAGSGFSYFVLARLDRGAGRGATREARAMHASFRPL